MLRTKEKGQRLLQAQKLLQYLRECDDALDWISDKVSPPSTNTPPAGLLLPLDLTLLEGRRGWLATDICTDR